MNTDYIARYGVYAVIPNPEQKQIVLVQEPNGAWFLPCGKIEAGENHQEALKRELIEELGFTAKFRSYFSQISVWIISKIVFKSISINFSWFCSFYLVV
ncbi:mutT/nudix family protein [Streptococcus pneumoniae]|nr:mutT/nudix family protein [Streptococcus pneumoniae]